jgi:hypothetical protein
VSELSLQHPIPANHSATPFRVFEISIVQDPRQFDVESSFHQVRDQTPGFFDQLLRIGQVVSTLPPALVEDEKRRLPDRTWRCFQILDQRELVLPSRPIIDAIQPVPQGISTFPGNGAESPPCTARIVDCQAGFHEQSCDFGSKCAGCEPRQQIAHRVTVQFVEPITSPRFKIMGFAVTQRIVQKTLRVFLRIEFRDQPVRRIWLEGWADREAKPSSSSHNRKFLAQVLDRGLGQTRVKDHEPYRQPVRSEREKVVYSIGLRFAMTCRRQIRECREDPSPGVGERLPIGQFAGLDSANSLFDDAASVFERHPCDREVAVKVEIVETWWLRRMPTSGKSADQHRVAPILPRPPGDRSELIGRDFSDQDECPFGAGRW